MSDPLRGTAKILIGTTVLLGKAGYVINENPDTFDIMAHSGDVLDTRLKSLKHEITFQHDGTITAEALAVLFPDNAPAIGQSVFNDTTLTVHDVNGKKRVYHNVALTKMGDLTLSTQSTAIGSLTFTAIHVSTATVIAGTDTLFTDSDEAWAEPEQDPANILTDLYAASWGDYTAPWDEFYGLNGIKVNVERKLTTEGSDRRGIHTMTLAAVTASATMLPEDITPAQLLAKQLYHGASAKIGGSLNSGKDLVLTGPGMIVTLKRVALLGNSRNYSDTKRQQGDVTFKAHRSPTSAAVITVELPD